MGCTTSSSANAPVSRGELTTNDVYNILRQIKPQACHLFDATYSLVSIDDIKAFAKLDTTNLLKYKSEAFDCDDFSAVCLGRVREWYGKGSGAGGICFGMITGDLRTNEQPDTPRIHAANIYISPEKEIWIFEPQNDTLQKLHPKSTVHIIIM